jgi:putative flippase GtrA
LTGVSETVDSPGGTPAATAPASREEGEQAGETSAESGVSPASAGETVSGRRFLGRDRKDYRRITGQFIRFGFVGASGVVVNLIVLTIMHKFNGGPENAGEQIWRIPGTDFWVRYRNIVYVVSFIVANTWNYQLNRLWTFRGSKPKWWRGLASFMAVGAVGAVIGLVVQIVLTHPQSPLYLPDPWFESIGTWRSRELWAQLIAVVVATPVNFVVNKLWTFRTIRHVHDPALSST